MGTVCGHKRVGGFAVGYGLLQRAKLDGISVSRSGPNRLFVFVCGFTCYRCWRGLLALGRLRRTLKASGIHVQVMGAGRYLEQARELAADLGLPFTFEKDESGNVQEWPTTSGPEKSENRMGTALLADGAGEVLFRQRFRYPEQPLDETALVEALGCGQGC